MPAVFCCSSIKPYRPQRLDHEVKFNQFMNWAHFASPAPSNDSSPLNTATYAVQLVKQVNYGPQESIRYFTPDSNALGFVEVTENDLLEANFEKLNSYKNFRCEAHNRFFEVNLYQKNPTNAHHWRTTLARPSRDIDLAFKQKKATEKPSTKTESTKQDDSPADAQLDTATLKSVLRFLLPSVKKNLGSKPFVSLLSLDWVNKELGLGLGIEDVWKAELTRDNIAAFIYDCSRSSANSQTNLTEAKIPATSSQNYPIYSEPPTKADRVKLREIKTSVDFAMRATNSLEKEHLSGQTKLQEIFNKTLELCETSDWASKCRDIITPMFTVGPNDQLLELCRRSDEELPGSLSLGFFKKAESGTHSGDDDYDHNNDSNDDNWNAYDEDYHFSDTHNIDNYGSDHDDEFKYLTACDRECGYCGTCPY
ncbi:mfs multidrug transporter [Trichoderma arundinaceum]|uniref:Mfs multidrug transporter n=1 Tax=Trichoderma arundinaceum TaxID=490622 RepID=A0A395NZD7_TRIAR|nr:mfs multidrug transporter [Trichoderma arundinaceum]